MAEWTNDQSDQITALYRQLKGGYEKEAYQKLFGGPQLPYEKARSILGDIIKKQSKEGGLEQKVVGSTPIGMFSGKTQYAFGLVGVLAVVAALALGMPYTPPPLY